MTIQDKWFTKLFDNLLSIFLKQIPGGFFILSLLLLPPKGAQDDHGSSGSFPYTGEIRGAQ
jgi:hypothetical protein